MDQLFLNAIGFPIRSATLSRSPGVRSWCIEIQCEESPQLDDRNGPDDRDEGDPDSLAGAEPYLYAQRLPLPVDSPDELVGQTYSFPQTADGDSSGWDRGVGWLFFCLYLSEHELVYPMTIGFPERRGKQYRVKIAGVYPSGESRYDLRAEAWLDWIE